LESPLRRFLVEFTLWATVFTAPLEFSLISFISHAAKLPSWGLVWIIDVVCLLTYNLDSCHIVIWDIIDIVALEIALFVVKPSAFTIPTHL
jgi:hypothetical protein